MENTKSGGPNDRHLHPSDYSELNFWERNRIDLDYLSKRRFETSTSTDKRDVSYFKDSRFKSRVNEHFESIASERSTRGKSTQKDRLSRMKNILKDISNQQDQLRSRMKDKKIPKYSEDDTYD
jgi:hypothetical protein